MLLWAVEMSWITLLCKYNISLIPVSPWPQPFSYPPYTFCMQLLKHVANAMQRAEGFVLERALVLNCSGSFNILHYDRCSIITITYYV